MSLTVYNPALKDFLLEISKGNIPGTTIMRGLGERISVGTGTPGEDLTRINELSATPSAPASTVLIPTPAAAGEQMTVISESAQDTSAGTGAKTLTIEYLDPTGAQQTTTVALNGQTAVDLTPSDPRFINDMYISELGSGNVSGVAAGNIRIYKKADDTLVYNMIAAGGNKSLVPHRMVPLGKCLHLKEWVGSEGKNKRFVMRLRADATNAIPGVLQAGVPLFKSTMFLNQSAQRMPLAYSVPALSIVKVSVWADVANGEGAVHWWGILADT